MICNPGLASIDQDKQHEVGGVECLDRQLTTVTAERDDLKRKLDVFCGVTIPELKAEHVHALAERDALLVDNAAKTEELEWFDDHLFRNPDTAATRRFITNKDSPESRRLLRLCDLLDSEALKNKVEAILGDRFWTLIDEIRQSSEA